MTSKIKFLQSKNADKGESKFQRGQISSLELRQSFLDFFAKKGHTIVPSSSLLPADPSVLFTSAGMQQFKPYYLGKKSPYGLNVASCQKCFRTSDIEEVGDNSHLTFIEMLGNFSFGSYFKEEAISIAYELLNSKFKINPTGGKQPNSKIIVTVFRGDNEIPRDEESIRIWSKFGFSEKKGNLRFAGREDNFWGPTGQDGPCGPTTEIYLQGIEVWNLVFNEYYQDREKKLTFLKQKGVDTGMGLERLAMVIQNKSSVFETDLFEPIIRELRVTNYRFSKENEKAERIIADHIKSAVFLISEGIFPSNVKQGYILRRILRRAIRHGKILGLSSGFLIPLAKKVVEIYQDVYPVRDYKGKKEEQREQISNPVRDYKGNERIQREQISNGTNGVYPENKFQETDILTIIQKEEENFSRTLEKGLKEFEKVAGKGEIDGQTAFHLYDTYGFPLEITEEMALEKGLKVDKKGFEQAFKKHQEISRAGAEKKFGGVGEKATSAAIKLHTATHLLHAALREVLGKNVRQMGSDITSERLRFDFFRSRKMTEDEIKKVENLINQKIKKALEVKKSKMPYKQAVEIGALAFFRESYPETVTVYSIGDWSKEICAGPHVKTTSELGNFRIIKEESSGANIRRIKAVLE